MKRVLSILHFMLSVLILLDIVVEYFLPGIGVFHTTVFQVRMATYSASQYAAGLLLLLALVGGAGRKIIGSSALLFALVLVQAVLTWMGLSVILHALDGIAILVVSAYVTWLGISKLRRPA